MKRHTSWKLLGLATLLALGIVAMLMPATSGAGVPSCGELKFTIVRGDRDNTIIGTPGSDYIDAGGGDDVIRARGGNDVVCAGPGRDLLVGAGGYDVLNGQGKPDTVRAGGSPIGYSDLLLGGRGNDDLFGQKGTDYLFGQAGGDDLCNGGEPADDSLKTGDRADPTCEHRVSATPFL
jgi:Ca2+-binding RTX toxin-like protein